MKRILFSLLLMLGLAAQAQINRDSAYFDKKATSVYADDTAVVHKIGLWVRNSTPDNWYLNLQVGPSLYNGLDDHLGPMLGNDPLRDGRLTWNAEAKIGRWVFPKLGYRFGAGIGYFHGFLSRDHFNPGQLLTNCGQGLSYPDYPGYFWDSNDPSLLIQRWRYFNVTGDMMIKLITVKGYRRDQQFVPYMMLGVSFLSSLSNDDVREHQDKLRFGAGIHAGLGLNWRISERWSLYGEARASMQSGTFDREWVAGIESATFNEDFPIFAHLGVEYRFNWRSEKRRMVWEQTLSDDKGVQAARTESEHQFVYDAVTIYDTFFFEYLIDSGLSPEADSALWRRAEQRASDIVDSLNDILAREHPNATLRDIFDNNLLPYEMVFFQLDKWDILSREALKIRKMAQVIRSLPGQQFLLIGSADSKTGTAKRNEFLSVNRADVVYNQLVYEYGIDPAQLQRIYMGGILDYEPFELNRATVIILNHPKVMTEFENLRSQHKAGGGQVEWNE